MQLRFRILFGFRWMLFRKSTRSLQNGVSLMIFRGSLAILLTTFFSKELYTCSYDSIDQTISYLKSFGLNALISKLDLSDAFCHILVDPRDCEILGSTWPLVMSDCSTRTGYFFDMLLSFALRSSPALFLKFVNGLRYQMALHGTLLELPPMFWACGPPAPSAACSSNPNVMLRTCADLGFTTNPL